jgi:hypothetical protein
MVDIGHKWRFLDHSKKNYPLMPWICYQTDMKFFSLTFKQLQESSKKYLHGIWKFETRSPIFESSIATNPDGVLAVTGVLLSPACSGHGKGGYGNG